MIQYRTVHQVLLVSVVLMALLLVCNGQVSAADSNLSWGSRGDGVAAVQNQLNARGFWCGSADGIFGQQTYSALVQFQRKNGLDPDGIVGPATRQALGLSSSSSTYTTPSRSSRSIVLVATGYCPCALCNYPYGGKPSYLGYALGRGIAAVDPNVVPMGVSLYIPGYGSAIAADQGNAIQGNRIDLCFATHQEALDWGIRTVTVSLY